MSHASLARRVHFPLFSDACAYAGNASCAGRYRHLQEDDVQFPACYFGQRHPAWRVVSKMQRVGQQEIQSLICREPNGRSGQAIKQYFAHFDPPRKP